ncbi:MAG: efflux RND transporter permease subunit, partial [Planctomycetota bacterium]
MDGGHPESRLRNPIIELATRRPVALLMISTAIFVFGLISLSGLPMDLMPEISYPTLTVRTRYPGAAPEDVEDRVSRRLEQALAVVKNLRRISSVSRAELSDVILEFGWDTDMKSVVQDVREKLDQTFLPDSVETPTILRYDPSLDPVLQIGLAGASDLKSLRLWAEEEVERRLETVKGIAAVRVRGGLEEEIRVFVNEERIRSRGITVAEISRRLAEENLDQASGLLREGNVTYVVRTRNELRSLSEMRRIPIRREGESIVRLGDLAEVVSGHKEEEVITRIDGRPAVKIEIYREAGANIVELAGRARRRLYGTPAEQQQYQRWKEQQQSGDYEGSYIKEEEPDEEDVEEDVEKDVEKKSSEPQADEEKTDDNKEQDKEKDKDKDKDKDKVPVARPGYIAAQLPEGIELVVLSDQSVFIEGSINDLRQSAILGGLLAIGVLYVFLRRFSYTAIVALSIPFSIVATFAPMYLTHISLNIMSLGGLALGLGMLVDSSIVVLESIFRRRQEGAAPFDAAVEGASEVGGAVFASTVTTVAVFFPIVFVEGMAGQVFRDQALTVVYSLIAALIVSLTLIPMLAARLGVAGARGGPP